MIKMRIVSTNNSLAPTSMETYLAQGMVEQLALLIADNLLRLSKGLELALWGLLANASQTREGAAPFSYLALHPPVLKVDANSLVASHHRGRFLLPSVLKRTARGLDRFILYKMERAQSVTFRISIELRQCSETYSRRIVFVFQRLLWQFLSNVKAGFGNSSP